MKAVKKQIILPQCHEGFFKGTPGICVRVEIKRLKQTLPFSSSTIRFAIEKILKKEHIHSACLTVVLTGDAFIRSLNKRFLLKDDTTDCLAFDLKPRSWPKNCLFGDVVVSVERAKAVSKAGAFYFQEELLRYIAHGILHLTGFDDVSPHKRKKMWERQEKLVLQISKFLK